jgi:SM-20-related protein
MRSRTERVDNKEIVIIDDAFTQDQIDAFYEYAMGLSFQKKERSVAADEFPIFSVDFHPDRFETDSFVGQKARNLLQAYTDKSGSYKLYRSYINLSNYGDVEFPHFDCLQEKEDLTILYYVNRKWSYKYGGETIFYENKDSKLAILPTPGRFVIFPGNVEHLGGVASRICKEPRLSLALKYNIN